MNTQEAADPLRRQAMIILYFLLLMFLLLISLFAGVGNAFWLFFLIVAVAGVAGVLYVYRYEHRTFKRQSSER